MSKDLITMDTDDRIVGVVELPEVTDGSLIKVLNAMMKKRQPIIDVEPTESQT